jgi:hypothetical protein
LGRLLLYVIPLYMRYLLLASIWWSIMAADTLRAQRIDYAQLMDKVIAHVPHHYDTTIHQAFRYMEWVAHDTAVDFFTKVDGLQTSININGYEDVKNKKHYIRHGYHVGYSSTRFGKMLFTVGGTYLTDFSKSFLSKFFMLAKLPHLANRIPPSFCTDTRLQTDAGPTDYQPLPDHLAQKGLVCFLATKQARYTHPSNSNPAWRSFTGFERSIYWVDPTDFSLRKKLTFFTLTNQTETQESALYETYRRFNGKYVQDTLLIKSISVADVNQCGCNPQGDYTYIFLEKDMPLADETAKTLLKGDYSEFDRKMYFDEFTQPAAAIAKQDDALRHWMEGYLQRLKSRYWGQ